MSQLTLTIYKDTKKEFRWNVKSSNGRIVADGGEGYKRLAGCKRMAEKLFHLTIVQTKCPIIVYLYKP